MRLVRCILAAGLLLAAMAAPLATASRAGHSADISVCARCAHVVR